MNVCSLKWEQWGVLLASGGRDLQLFTIGILSSNDCRKSLPVPLQDTTHRVIRSSQGSKQHLTLFLYHLGHSWTLQYSLEPITQNQSKGHHGPCPPGKAQITVCFSSKPGTIPTDNVESMPKQVLQLSSTIHRALHDLRLHTMGIH